MSVFEDDPRCTWAMPRAHGLLGQGQRVHRIVCALARLSVREVQFVDVQMHGPCPEDLRDGELLTEAILRKPLGRPTNVTAVGRLRGGRWVAAFHVKLTGAPLTRAAALELALAMPDTGLPAVTRTVDMVQV